VRVWVERLLRDGVVAENVLFETDADGTVISEAAAPRPADAVGLTFAVPGFGNAHSHAFHRALRGRTHEGGSFWTWRETMYRAAGRLDPDSYRELASGVFGEMVANGWTAVGEFHYLHHAPDGARYPAHAMEMAIADAAADAGIRLVLLDTAYLSAGVAGEPLSERQRRFSDGDAAGYLDRWHALRSALAGRSPLVTLGAALHSVRGVPRDAMVAIVAGLPADVPLHIHLSEQPAENAACLAVHGLTPTGLLAECGILSPRLAVVHATHLTEADIGLLGAARVHAVFCPTTEADLGDGIGPAVEVIEAGVRLALGSDQNAVVDPLLEMRGLEAGERLRSLRRGRVEPAALWQIAGAGGYGALGLPAPARVGGPLDLVELDLGSTRTAGAIPVQVALAATGSDVIRTVVGGRVVHDRSDAAPIAARLARSISALLDA
jgi:formiminoglutamate deiminase